MSDARRKSCGDQKSGNKVTVIQKRIMTRSDILLSSKMTREHLLCWSEHRPREVAPTVAYGTTRDFKAFNRDPRGYAKWPRADGLISPWREGDTLYLFAGKFLHELKLRN